MKSIKTKLLRPLIAIVMAHHVVMVIACVLLYNNFMESRNVETLAVTRKAVESKIRDQLLLVRQSAARFALHDQVVDAISRKDAAAAENILRALVYDSEVDLCLATDAHGVALVRTHSDARGDALDDYEMVREALAGRHASTINSGTATRLSMNGSAPVYNRRGELIGSIMAGTRLDDNAYVDKVKEVTGHEIEVFLGEECISTTFVDGGGNRFQGMTPAPDVIRDVLAGGERAGAMRAGGNDYYAQYSPFVDDGEVIGMLVLGIPTLEQGRATRGFLMVGACVCLVAILLVVLLVYGVIDGITRPIYALTRDFESVTNNGGRIPERRPAASDIAEVNVLQDALRKMLEQINSVSLLQWRNRQAEIEKERILAASEAKIRGFANISHEIRTPMNAIIGITEILMGEGGLNRRQEEYLRDANVSAKALLEIVNEVLDVSKLGAGKMKLKPVDYDFRELMGGVRSMAAHLVEEKGLDFEYAVRGEIPECLYGDDVRLRQILLNLLGNAVKFTERGRVSLRVEIGDESIRFAVADSGIGIPADKIPRLFVPFEQVEDGANRRVAGTGLGLPICKGLAELMGGTLHFESGSENSKGSVFVAIIPKCVGRAENIRREPDGESGGDAIDKGARVLVVDDNIVNLNVACGIIRILYGIECDTAKSGPECLAKADANVYDIIFMDYMMPGMDGVETTAALRKKGGYLADAPIIALSSDAVNGMRDFFIENGLDGFLSKPIIKSELQAIMRTWVGRDGVDARKDSARIADANRNREATPGLNVAEGLGSVNDELDALRASLAGHDYNAVCESAKRLRQLLQGLTGDAALDETTKTDLNGAFSCIEQFDYDGALSKLTTIGN